MLGHARLPRTVVHSLLRAYLNLAKAPLYTACNLHHGEWGGQIMYLRLQGNPISLLKYYSLEEQKIKNFCLSKFGYIFGKFIPHWVSVLLCYIHHR